MESLIVPNPALVGEKASGMRLDVFLSQHLVKEIERYGLTRSRMQKLIEEGVITVNGAPTRSSRRLKPSDSVEVGRIPNVETKLRGEDVLLDIIYEDRDCLVINKAPGMVVHPAAGNVSGTLVNALLHHCPELKGIGAEGRPGIVHRLDKDTSGVMVVAKNHGSLQMLSQQFKDRTVRKEYLALVWGKFEGESGIIDRPIGRHRSQRKKMSCRFAYSKKREALTEWNVEQRFELKAGVRSTRWVSLCRLRPKTGRTHQIRVHLAELGHPVVGDKVYGWHPKPDLQNSNIISLLYNFPRQALHAEKLEITHPTTNRRIEFKAVLYTDIHGVVKELEKRRLTKIGVDNQIAFQ
jgi:23S rRNA pseudouridine1911/1915/1917 synthase